MVARRNILLPVVLVTFFGLTWVRHTPDSLGESPDRSDRCPVCGMFVFKYPEWIAQIQFESQPAFFFDGPKDLFRFYFFEDQYCEVPDAERQVEAILVTDYYTTQPIDAKQAFFVLGSDVFGPMGHELVPFRSAAAAVEFLEDHSGERVLRFEEVTPDLILNL